MITIIDYGLGNLASVGNALEKITIPYKISSDPDSINNATAIILPGVGAAGYGIKNLKEQKLDKLLIQKATEGIPILGICLGMQLLFTKSEEGNVKCLNIIEGEVKKFTTNLKVPQIGWNNVTSVGKTILLKNIPKDSYFYFVHSYYCIPDDGIFMKGKTNYSTDFCSVVEKKNMYGVQFHPEKSGDAGLQLLRNFWEVACK